MQAYEISSDPTRLDTKAIHAFLSGTYWSPGIPLSTVERAVWNSVCVGAYAGSGQVGFGRFVAQWGELTIPAAATGGTVQVNAPPRP